MTMIQTQKSANNNQNRNMGKNGGNNKNSQKKKQYPGSSRMKKPSVKCTIPELSGHIFDCSGFRQAEDFKKTKEALESYATTYSKYGSDLRVTLENLEKFKVPEVTQMSHDELKDNVYKTRMHQKEIDEYMARSAALEEGMRQM